MVHQFEFEKKYAFENDVVRLSPLKAEHIEHLTKISADEEIWTYFLESGQGEKLASYCSSAIQKRTLGEEYPFVIFDKRANQYAGMTRLYAYDNGLGVIKMGHTWLGRSYWGTKLNVHCKYLLFEFIFEKLAVERIGFGVHGENKRSIIALQNIGCKQEGQLRNFLCSIHDNSRVDLLLFSILIEDWQPNIKAILTEKIK